MELKHFFTKKNSEQPIIETKRETPYLLINFEQNFFNLKISVFWIWHGQKWGASNLLHPPTSTLNIRSQNHSCVFSKFTYLHNFKKAVFQQWTVLER